MVLEPQNRFTRREGIERGSVRAAFFVFLGVVAVIGWSYIFFVSEAFMIKDIEVRGVKSLDAVDVKREVYDIVDKRPKPFWQPARHIVFIKQEELAPLIAERLFAEHVTIDKQDSHILRLMIQERARKFILHTPHQSLWVDLQGTVLQELTLVEAKHLSERRAGKRLADPNDAPIIFLDGVSVLKPAEVVPDGRIQTWLDITREVQKQGIRYREIQPESSPSSTRLTLKTLQGYNLWLDTSETLERQIEAYKAFEKQKPKDVVIHEYVDVRIPNRIYVK